MSFGSVVGQDRAASVLRRALATQRVAHAYLFAGIAGIGKMTMAREFAAALVCGRGGEDACGECSHCVKAKHGNHPDIHYVEPIGKGRLIPIGVFRDPDTGEGLIKDLHLKPMEAARKVALIDDAHAMNNEAANCLLKTLEEPPPGSVIVLVTPRPDGLAETIVSRCQTVRFAPLAAEVIEAKLLEKRGADPKLAAFLARSSGGSLGRALEVAEGEEVPRFREEVLRLLGGLNASNLTRSAAVFVKLGRELADSAPDSEMALSELRASVEWLLEMVELFYRDVLMRQLGLTEQICNADVMGMIDAETRISPRRIRAILDTIEDAKGYLRSNVDPESVVLDSFSRIAACRATEAA